MANRVWIRDSVVWKSDFGSDDGTFSMDLLWKARTGFSQSTGPDPAPAVELPKVADVPSVLDSLCDYVPRPVHLSPDLRVPGTVGVPTTLNLVGARILRVRMSYGLIFAPLGAPIAPDYEAVALQGWYEGLIVAPFNHAAVVMPYATGSQAILGEPNDEKQAVSLDWLWWSRKYTRELSYRMVGISGFAFTDSLLAYSSIDTKNSRRFDQYGTSLYWQINANGNNVSAPLQGSTINGGVANWSILLELPG